VPADKLEEETQAMAVKLSLVPPEVMRLTKQPINRTYEIMGLFEALKTNFDYSSVLHTADIPELVEFERIIEEQGLKAALRWRETRYS
jgi:enoyl-CoA hydratase